MGTVLNRKFKEQGGRCFYCDEPMVLHGPFNTPTTATRDHILPRSARSPLTARLNAISVAACLKCNSERGRLPAHEYMLIWEHRLKEEADGR